MKNDQIEQLADNLAETTYNFFSSCDEKENNLARLKGLTQVEFRCMRLFKANEITNNKKIAARMNLSPSRLTRIIDGLVSKGFVKREIDREDRRNMKLYLSDNGCGFIQSINSEYNEVHCKMLEEVKPEHREVVVVAIGSLFNGLDKWYNKKISSL